ncbi:BnaA06g20350D [Brassica napus]|uniref:BnaA06g20350D protein n=1 Tax=Brassica napus TaxID=3708 RepID=A0A078H481_BRANA|nr:BnaA06g20350D [Brassica napus]
MVVIQLQVFNLTERIDPDHDAKLANKVLIAKKKSIEEGAERFRRDLLQNLSNNLVSSTVLLGYHGLSQPRILKKAMLGHHEKTHTR